ncbi:MAG: GerAB/ArcD/ProY family transporter, partial [Clostridia bacterium]
FLTNELFIQATPALFFIVFLVPVLYLGIKGARTIARTSEIFTILLFLGIIINLAFLKSDIDFGRNLPILALEPSDFFTNSLKYGLWLGDLMPIIFIKMQQKKAPYIGISVGVSAVLILISVALGISMYGDAMPFVANMLVEIAGFNQLSLEIGRMEWISLFIVVTMAIFTMSLLFWGVLSCSERIFKSRKPMMFMYPTILIIVLFTAPSMQSIANVAFTNLGYVAFAFAVIFPFALLLTLAVAKKRHHVAKPKNIESEGNQEINTDSINTEAKTPASTSSSPLSNV